MPAQIDPRRGSRKKPSAKPKRSESGGIITKKPPNVVTGSTQQTITKRGKAGIFTSLPKNPLFKPTAGRKVRKKDLATHDFQGSSPFSASGIQSACGDTGHVTGQWPTLDVGPRERPCEKIPLRSKGNSGKRQRLPWRAEPQVPPDQIQAGKQRKTVVGAARRSNRRAPSRKLGNRVLAKFPKGPVSQ